MVIANTAEPIVMQKETEQIVKILDAKYHKADLSKVTANAVHFNTNEKKKLYELLLKYKDLFNGTLGVWKTDPVDYEMVEDAKPHSQRHYSVPHLYKDTLKREID